MKKILFMAVAAIAVLSGCSNNDEFEPKQTGKQGLVFTATMEGSEATRATFDDTQKCAAWEAGDKISINGKIYSAQAAGTATTFEADDEGATGTTYNAYFPASLYNNGTPTLPDNINETWADVKFNMPMYAYSTTTELAFKNLCGVLKITVKNDQLTSVKCIKVSSSNCATSGAFTVEGNAAKLTDASKTANTVTVTYTTAVSTDADATGKVFYIAIPAQTYKNLKIELSADGTNFTKSMTTKKDVDILVERNKIYNITFQDNAPTTGTAKRKGDIDVNWVQLWAGGPKWAEYNIGSKSATDEDCGYFTWADDIASTEWGSNWRMPTKDEFEALLENCECEWVEDYNGVDGLLCTGKGAYKSNSIFFFAAGYNDGSIQKNYFSGLYWSSTIGGTFKYTLTFDWEGSMSAKDYIDTSKDAAHLPVRPVLNETK